MDCDLCKKPIKNYDLRFNHLVIDENHSSEICIDCIDKFSKWQSRIHAELFPTKTMKKIYKK